MGNRSIAPKTEKKISMDENNTLEFVNCEMQGWREKMVRIIYKDENYYISLLYAKFYFCLILFYI